MDKNIFEIVDATPVLPSTWLVRGRAYQEIVVGDTVAVKVTTSPNTNELLHFNVIAATTYGVLVPGLDEGRTGGLTLQGDHAKYGEQIRMAKFLIST